MLNQEKDIRQAGRKGLALGVAPQAARHGMEKYDKSFKPDEKKALEMKLLINEPYSPQHRGG